MMKTDIHDLILEDYNHVVGDKSNMLSNLKNDVVVITGGTGFVGTWLAGLLAYLNDYFSFNIKIVLIARNTDNFKKKQSGLANRNDIKLIPADIRYLHELPTETNWLIHAAGTPDNRVHATYPLEVMSVIAQGTQSVLRAVERCSNFKMLLNVSSGLIYGQQPIGSDLIDEEFMGAPKCGTVSSAYAEAKRFSETLCHSSRSQSRIPILNVRPFAFMGPYQSLETPWALNSFIKDALTSKAIRVLGDGKSVRSYMYASDMAFWLLTMLAQGNSGEIYNLGSPQAVTLEQLAQAIAAECDSSLDIQLNTSSSHAMTNTRFVPDVSLAQETFKLDICVNLETAIKKTFFWNKLC